MGPWCNGSISGSNPAGQSSNLWGPAIDIGVERIGRNWIIQIKTSEECFTRPSQCLLYGAIGVVAAQQIVVLFASVQIRYHAPYISVVQLNRTIAF